MEEDSLKLKLDLGLKLQNLRTEKGITQEQLSKILNVSTSIVGMYETGARKPSYEVLIKLADYFDVTTDFLLGRGDSKTIYTRVSALEKKMADLERQLQEQPNQKELADMIMRELVERINRRYHEF